MTIENRIRSVIRDIPDFPKPGILFKDITPVLMDPVLCNDIADAFYSHFNDRRVDAIVGVESRGFLFGMLLAQKFGVPFVPVRKKGKLPAETLSYEYSLEYGTATVEIHKDALASGAHVLIHDDLLATGGTAAAAAELVSQLNASVIGFAFLVGLDFLMGNKVLEKHSDSIYSIVTY